MKTLKFFKTFWKFYHFESFEILTFFVYWMGVTIITGSNVCAILLFTECHVNRFDPPIHGILTPLSMVYQTLFYGIMNPSLLVEMRGVNLPWGKIDPGVNISYENWPRGQNTIWHRSFGLRPVRLFGPVNFSAFI